MTNQVRQDPEGLGQAPEGQGLRHDEARGERLPGRLQAFRPAIVVRQDRLPPQDPGRAELLGQ